MTALTKVRTKRSVSVEIHAYATAEEVTQALLAIPHQWVVTKIDHHKAAVNDQRDWDVATLHFRERI